jgi:hypothetical protein
VPLTCSDINGDPTTLSVTSGPAHGTLSAIDQGQVTYTPAPGYVGANEFSFAASDGGLSSAGQTVTLTDLPLPDPVIRSFTVLPKRFAVARGATAVSARRRKKAPRGTTLSYFLSDAGSLRITIERKATGRLVGGRCLPNTRKRRNRKRCTRYVKQGTLTRSPAAGAGTTKFTGRIGTRALAPAVYRATIVETAVGALHASAPRTARFTIVAR